MWASIGRVTGRLLFFLFGLHVPCAARERGSGPERSRMRDFLSRSIFPLGFLVFGYFEMVIVRFIVLSMCLVCRIYDLLLVQSIYCCDKWFSVGCVKTPAHAPAK